MADRDRRGAGERIVGLCVGALACAICLTFTVELLKDLWPWLVAAHFTAIGVVIYRWNMRRW